MFKLPPYPAVLVWLSLYVRFFEGETDFVMDGTRNISHCAFRLQLNNMKVKQRTLHAGFRNGKTLGNNYGQVIK